MIPTKEQTRQAILAARDEWGLIDAEMARLLVGEGRGGRGTNDKWVLPPDHADLRKASEAAVRHIETLRLLAERCPSAFKMRLEQAKKTG